jgi:hypothetical protein
MPGNEDAVLKETIKHLEEAARRIRASRYLLQEDALVEDPEYLPLVAHLSWALDMTEAARQMSTPTPPRRWLTEFRMYRVLRSSL